MFLVLNSAWAEEKQRDLNAIDEGPVNLNGDGRCDSPGHSAKYGTYKLMSDKGEVITSSLVQVTEVASSNAMQKEGFERCFKAVVFNRRVGIPGGSRGSCNP